MIPITDPVAAFALPQLVDILLPLVTDELPVQVSQQAIYSAITSDFFCQNQGPLASLMQYQYLIEPEVL